MNKIKYFFRKTLFCLFKKKKMPYNHPDIQMITNFLQAKFVGYIPMRVTYNDGSINSYSNPNEISLDYTIVTASGDFYLNIKYNKRLGAIHLTSTGNEPIPLTNLGTVAPLFIVPYMSFEKDKNQHLLGTFQQLP